MESGHLPIESFGRVVLWCYPVKKHYVTTRTISPPKAGINTENVDALRKKSASFTGNQRYVVLVMDEMKIQSDLVFDKNSGDLVGFMDLGDPMTNFACLDDKDMIATHALAFLVRGLCTDVKHIIAYFFTGNVTSYQLMPILWKVVSTLELSLDLWVVALVNDGASPNRKLFNLHVKLAIDRKCDVVYKTINLFAPSRFIYFFADVPHLMKTARNCLYNSGSGSCSRLMWNDGQYLLFKHIADIFYRDQAVALHVLPKLTLEHIALTSFSKMKVKLATQVLSRSVALALQESGNNEVLGTAEFCRMMNDFFDCTNVRSLHGIRERETTFSNPTLLLMMIGLVGYVMFSCSTWRIGKALLFKGMVNIQQMIEQKCSFHLKPMKVFRFQLTPILRLSSSYFNKASSTS